MRCSRRCSRRFMSDIGRNWSSSNDGFHTRIWFGWIKPRLYLSQKGFNYSSIQAGQMTEKPLLHTKISALVQKFNSENLSKKSIIPTTTSSTNSLPPPVHSIRDSIPTTIKSQTPSTSSFAAKKSSPAANVSTNPTSSKNECLISASQQTEWKTTWKPSNTASLPTQAVESVSNDSSCSSSTLETFDSRRYSLEIRSLCRRGRCRLNFVIRKRVRVLHHGNTLWRMQHDDLLFRAVRTMNMSFSRLRNLLRIMEMRRILRGWMIGIKFGDIH